MKKLFLIILWFFLLFSCQAENAPQETAQPHQVETSKTSKNEEQQKIWQLYCNLWRITELYTIAPNSQKYNDLSKNGSDIPSQKWVASKLLAEWIILDIDWQIKYFSENKDNLNFPKTVNLLTNAQKGIYTTLEEMKNIDTVEDFKRNFSTFLTWMEILSSIPEKSVSEWVDDILFQNAAQTKFLLCNNNVWFDFWWWEKQESKNQTPSSDVPQFDKMDIHIWITTENLNIRETPHKDWKIVAMIPKWEYVVYTPFKTIKNDGYEWWIVWYNEWNAYGFSVTKYINYVQPIPEKYRTEYSQNTQNYNNTYNHHFSSPQSFRWYECTIDCSWHQAWYNWAERKDIDNVDDCGGNSQSFIEWCWAYVENNY